MLQGADNARHLGMTDGMKGAFGYPSVGLDHPDTLAHPEAYAEGVEEGIRTVARMRAGGRSPFTTTNPPSLWQRFKAWCRS